MNKPEIVQQLINNIHSEVEVISPEILNEVRKPVVKSDKHLQN